MAVDGKGNLSWHGNMSLALQKLIKGAQNSP
jgi:hypothetical protein